MIERRSGLIVNIGSVVGEVGPAWSGIYNASKAALHSLSRTLEMEVSNFGIEVLL
jgi:short-subunit dehydrogenase